MTKKELNYIDAAVTKIDKELEFFSCCAIVEKDFSRRLDVLYESQMNIRNMYEDFYDFDQATQQRGIEIHEDVKLQRILMLTLFAHLKGKI